MARQEQDFNKERNWQSTTLHIKDSSRVVIDMTEVQCTQVLQSLIALHGLQGRLKPLDQLGPVALTLLKLLGRVPEGELQDVEVNSLLQGQSIRIENCTDVSIKVQQVEVEKVLEIGLDLLALMERQSIENGK